MRKTKRAARVARTLKQFSGVFCKTTTWTYHINICINPKSFSGAHISPVVSYDKIIANYTWSQMRKWLS